MRSAHQDLPTRTEAFIERNAEAVMLVVLAVVGGWVLYLVATELLPMAFAKLDPWWRDWMVALV